VATAVPANHVIAILKVAFLGVIADIASIEGSAVPSIDAFDDKEPGFATISRHIIEEECLPASQISQRNFHKISVRHRGTVSRFSRFANASCHKQVSRYYRYEERSDRKQRSSRPVLSV
jgi:hypothetical protein